MKRKGAVVKIDLSKAYDRISWTYHKMLLTHLGFKIDFINWIMGCITSVNFVVLINGVSSPFFKGQRGLRQGCHLSPLLFLLVAEGLSQLILKAKREGTVKGLEVAVNLFISHLLFVDEILLFSNGNMTEIKELKNILELFMKATGMQVNYRKSQLILKVSLTWVPKGILEKIGRICNRFLWVGSKEDSVLPWVAWEKVARPKEWGGWGIKDLPAFGPSLVAKLGWRIIKMENLWTKVVKQKYIDPIPLEKGIRNPNKKGGNVSVVWKATIEAFKDIEQGLVWQIGNGANL
eukprot:PITA_26386